MAAKSIAVIQTSTRGVRLGPHVAAFVKETLEKKADLAGITVAAVDLVDFKLPVFDEAIVPAQIPEHGNFVKEHSKAWSAEIKKHDAYIIVSPEYNYSVPGSTKNAIDYLMNEWKGKPIGIVTYGLFGGSQASEVLSHILDKMGLRVASTRPQLAFAGGFGPDAFAAMSGNLGADTKAKWEKEDAEKVLQTFEEIKALLATPNGQPVGA